MSIGVGVNKVVRVVNLFCDPQCVFDERAASAVESGGAVLR